MSEEYSDLINIGNFTRNAVKSFEKNIVNKTNYLESVEANTNFKNNYSIKEKSNE
ncbi:hypothetical protein PMY56_16330 [Clostridium tertium]|jgi:hypothetical protein|uniref:Uncharacterized protein n=1 Tax=Clostridium tertium TaxID=1559 RepID=A0A9X4AZV3_9CLOT|nr:MULTISPECIES: hypothetical protein [Clostridium]EEH97727.1 hypothetical protein CSBG_01353 [Clostridium sp. 7_2_43FAA]MBS5308292.1 hypothetical protein [Clostridium sp.]MBS5885480.1 hypothetical protein [Clostridium sp.]MBS6503493.1 hypothetical protein [Clostridium sp.]MBU6135265.1 hypothetical protein [Clostridium tertium]